jgi:restriction system protein
MAETTRLRMGQIIQAVLQVLVKYPEGLQVRTVTSEVEKILPLTEHEQSFYPDRPGSRRFDKIIRFSTIGPVKAGWLVKDKGIWTLTAEGHEALTRYPDPLSLMQENVRRYYEWKKSARAVEGDSGDSELVEDDSPSATLEEAEESAWAEITDYLENMPPYEFQELVAALLRAMGYHVPWVAPRGRDGGVDVIAFTDPIGAVGPRIKVQVKRYSSGKIGVEGLRSFLAVLGAQDVGLFVSLGGFTSDAEMEARAQDNRRLMLIDMRQLMSMWIEHYDKLTEVDKARLPLRPVYFLSPID